MHDTARLVFLSANSISCSVSNYVNSIVSAKTLIKELPHTENDAVIALCLSENRMILASDSVTMRITKTDDSQIFKYNCKIGLKNKA